MPRQLRVRLLPRSERKFERQKGNHLAPSVDITTAKAQIGDKQPGIRIETGGERTENNQRGEGLGQNQTDPRIFLLDCSTLYGNSSLSVKH